jgi:myo-inositol catabolism protein IolC
MTTDYKKDAKKMLIMAKDHEKKYRSMIQLAGREKTPQNTLKTLNLAQIEKKKAQKLELNAIQLLKKDAGDKIGKVLTKPMKMRTRFNA